MENFEGIQGARECKNCRRPIIPGGVWVGTYWAGWEHFWTQRQMCIVDDRPLTDGRDRVKGAEPRED